MRKVVFTVQVFGVMALFPIYVILEMNHGTGKLTRNKDQQVVKERIEKTAIRASFNAEARNENSIRVTYLWVRNLRFGRVE